MRLPGGGINIGIHVLKRKRDQKKVNYYIYSRGEKNSDNNNGFARLIGINIGFFLKILNAFQGVAGPGCSTIIFINKK